MSISQQDLIDAAEDLGTIETVVNSDAAATVTSRLGQPIKTLRKAIQTVGFKAEIVAWTPTTAYSDFQQLISESGVVYRLVKPHTSTATFADDLAAGNWAPVTLSLADISDAELSTASGTDETASDSLNKRVITRDTEADMIATSELIVGVTVVTLGKVTPGDGEGQTFRVVASGGDVTLANGNEALIVSKVKSASGASQTVAGALDDRVVRVGSVAEGIPSLDESLLIDRADYYATEWGEGSGEGGGPLYYDASRAKSDHDGIAVFSPTVPAVSSQPAAQLMNRETQYRKGDGETDPTGNGVLVRTRGPLSARDAGARYDGIFDDGAAISAYELFTGDKGAELIGYEGRSADSAIRQLYNDRTDEIPPQAPTIGTRAKLVMTADDGRTYVATNKAKGKSGYVLMEIGNEVAASDADNVGGASNYRLQTVRNCSNVFVGKTKATSKSAGVVLSGLASSFIDGVWGYFDSGVGSAYFAQNDATSDFDWQSRELYNVPDTDNIVYSASGEYATVRLGLSGGSTTSCKIEVSRDNSAFNEVETVNLRMSASATGYRDIKIKAPISDETWYIRVTNISGDSSPMYVAGINIAELRHLESFQVIDSAIALQLPSIDGAENVYLSQVGANEFAARELDDKFFGTYHGGHSSLVERIRTDSQSFSLPTVPDLVATDHVTLYSDSTLTKGATTYQFTSSTAFGDGATVTNYSVKLESGPAIVCERVFTHMATVTRNFDFVTLPLSFLKEDDETVELGNCGFIQVFRGEDGATINTSFTQQDVSDNSFNGAYILFQTANNKQYYGPAVSSDSYKLEDLNIVTCKEFF